MDALDVDRRGEDALTHDAQASGGRRRALLLTAAALSFALIFALRELTVGAGDDFGDAIGLIYLLPICLVALELGLRAGLLAAACIFAAIVISLALQGGELAVAPLIVRGVVLLAAAALTGLFSERARSHRHRDAIELAVLRGEIEGMRERLRDQLRNAGRLLQHQESERREIALQLHDEAAQTLAAALLTVRMLERGADGGLAGPQLSALRSQVKACIGDLRQIADSLRPPVLDEMGLLPALQRISEVEAEAGRRRVSFHADKLPASLPREVETSTYRLVEDLLGALSDVAAIDAELAETEGSLRLRLLARLAGSDADGDGSARRLQERLIAARVRAELQGGSLAIELAGGEIAVTALLPAGISAAAGRDGCA